MKNIVRLILRKILKIREKETIKDGLYRHKWLFLKKINKRKYSIADIEEELKNCGITSKDTIFVQSSWRAFVGFDGEPRDVIDLFMKITGKEGNILMPSFGYDSTKIDIENDSTSLGVIAEEFRKIEGTIRSYDSYFPICANGGDSSLFLENHKYSISPFDDKSPFEKLVEINGKLVFIGLGKYPYKVSFIHYFVNKMSESQNGYKNIFNKEIVCTINDKNDSFEKKIMVRSENYSNNNKEIKKAMKKVKHEYTKLNYLDIYVCNTQDLLTELYHMDKEGYIFYKKRKRI